MNMLTLAELDAVVEGMTPGLFVVSVWPGEEDTKDGRHLYVNNPEDRENHRRHIASWMVDGDAQGFLALRNHYAAMRAWMRRAEELLKPLAATADWSDSDPYALAAAALLAQSTAPLESK